MFYNPRSGDHGLRHDPFKAIVAPRPIGWISSVDAEGRPNLAPYSFFNAISSRPHIVMFASTGIKDSVKNIEATGEFVCNLAVWDLREQMNTTSAGFPHGQSEFEAAGLEAVPSKLVRPPRVAAAPAALECRFLKSDRIATLDGEWSGTVVVYGEVVGIHIDESVIVDGRFDVAAAKTIARCGYMDYAIADHIFELKRPAGASD